MSAEWDAMVEAGARALLTTMFMEEDYAPKWLVEQAHADAEAVLSAALRVTLPAPRPTHGGFCTILGETCSHPDCDEGRACPQLESVEPAPAQPMLADARRPPAVEPEAHAGGRSDSGDTGSVSDTQSTSRWAVLPVLQELGVVEQLGRLGEHLFRPAPTPENPEVSE